MQAVTRIGGAPPARIFWLRIVACFAVSTLCPMAGLAQELTPPESSAAESLRNRYEALTERLEQSPLQQGLYLESVERSQTLRGDVYAVVDYPFRTVSDAFSSSASLCDALILHLNIKYCRAELDHGRPVLLVAIGKKTEQPVSDTYQVEFDYNINTLDANYMQVNLDANEGPVGTKDYRIVLEIVALGVERAFVHIQFSYANGFGSRLATNLYLASAGKDKVGFTQIVGADHPQPQFIGGVRGIVERNTMRYFLAVDSYLSTLAIPPPERFKASAERWFAATERYALQLRELDRDTYVAMKLAEYQRQNLALRDTHRSPRGIESPRVAKVDSSP